MRGGLEGNAYGIHGFMWPTAGASFGKQEYK